MVYVLGGESQVFNESALAHPLENNITVAIGLNPFMTDLQGILTKAERLKIHLNYFQVCNYVCSFTCNCRP